MGAFGKMTARLDGKSFSEISKNAYYALSFKTRIHFAPMLQIGFKASWCRGLCLVQQWCHALQMTLRSLHVDWSLKETAERMTGMLSAPAALLWSAPLKRSSSQLISFFISKFITQLRSEVLHSIPCYSSSIAKPIKSIVYLSAPENSGREEMRENGLLKSGQVDGETRTFKEEWTDTCSSCLQPLRNRRVSFWETVASSKMTELKAQCDRSTRVLTHACTGQCERRTSRSLQRLDLMVNILLWASKTTRKCERTLLSLFLLGCTVSSGIIRFGPLLGGNFNNWTSLNFNWTPLFYVQVLARQESGSYFSLVILRH